MKTLNGFIIRKHKGFWLSTRDKVAGLFNTRAEAISFTVQQLFIK